MSFSHSVTVCIGKTKAKINLVFSKSVRMENNSFSNGPALTTIEQKNGNQITG